LDTLVADIRDDLEQFGVHFDCWFSERSLVDSGAITRAIETLKTNNHLYQQDGAWWFRSTAFGDEKDRVVLRENGAHTYFAADIAYHLNKVERGFAVLIDIWGADHHGYIPRVKASFSALGQDPQALHLLLVQFAVLYRGREKISMSTRGGSFVTLRALRHEVGNDAARFFYILRKSEQHMDFDLDLAKTQSNENPVYYIQYAHARICSVFRQAAKQGIVPPESADYSKLLRDNEQSLVAILARYPEVVATAASHYEPHLIAYYLRDLATELHSYYTSCRFLKAQTEVRNARLRLLAATRQTLANGLGLLGVLALKEM
ncbi:MAG TPA: arginine--tRNA ligase, partial [Gammaproteobacteria bacterium]|nr:arginine--tRNA ligase [Gammaproteobacteria bacterium]